MHSKQSYFGMKHVKKNMKNAGNFSPEKNPEFNISFDMPPASIVHEDFWKHYDRTKIKVNDDLKKILIGLSCKGHACEGHSTFERISTRYPFVTLDYIYGAAGLNPDRVKETAHRYAYMWPEWYNLHKHDKNAELVIGKEPLLGVHWIESMGPVQVRQLLKYGVFTALMDNYAKVRKPVSELYGVKIGGGDFFPVIASKLKQNRMIADDLSHTEKFDGIESLIDNGIIDYTRPDAEYCYVRLAEGLGLSDELALIFSNLAGKNYDNDASYSSCRGSHIFDFIDTIDVPMGNLGVNLDEKFACEVMADFPDLVNMAELFLFVYSCVGPKVKSSKSGDLIDANPSSSAIYLNKICRENGRTEIEHHLGSMPLYEGKDNARVLQPMPLGFHSIPSNVFDKIVADRNKEYERIRQTPEFIEKQIPFVF